MGAIHATQTERSLQRAMAIECAKNYCQEQGLLWDRLKEQRFDLLGGIAVFSQPSDVESNGLVNDRDTMPKPTLVIRFENGQLVFEQTEHTREFLLK